MPENRHYDAAQRILRHMNGGHEPYAATVLPMARALEAEELRTRAHVVNHRIADKTTIPKLHDADIGEHHVFAMYAWQEGHDRVMVDPAVVVALADEVLVRRKADGNG